MDDLSLLIDQVKQGDKKAFSKIYQLFYKRIFRFCQINLFNTDQAEDLCQETFIKAWQAIPKFSLDSGGSFQAFLFKIARNMIIDLSRKKREIQLDKIAEPEKEIYWDEEIDRENSALQLRQALNLLDDTDKQIITLRYFEELSFFEIAKVTGIKEGSLRVKVHRILNKLKDRI